MQLKAILGAVLATGMAVNAQQMNIRGKVSDGSGKALANAIVELAGLKKKDTTGTDGMYSFSGSVNVRERLMAAQAQNIILDHGVLELAVTAPNAVKIEVFGAKGSLVASKVLDKAAAGVYRLDLAGKLPGGNLLIVKASIGNVTKTFPYFPLEQGEGLKSASFAKDAVLEIHASTGARLAKTSATVDTLKVSAAGFTANAIPLSSYDSTVNVTLGTSGTSGDRWGGLKNAPIKSAGCGKALGVISKSGTYHVSSAGGRGDYIVDVPTGYDKDTPYRLIFGNHCMGGTAIRVAETEKGSAGDDLSGFYSIKTMAAKDNIPAIYVAMQGDAGGTWSLPNDSKFWNDVLTLVETNMCVDTTRVFVTGFSFGAMFSYVLSLEYPEKIRAVATYAPANYNMTQPTNRHIPIAYYQTTGTSDGTCPWVNNDSQKKGGKYCLLQHMEDNGCTSTATDIKIATSSTHVSTEFAGCKEGYPVKFSSFQAGHQAVHTDPGTNFSWIEKEAWEFFKRF